MLPVLAGLGVPAGAQTPLDLPAAMARARGQARDVTAAEARQEAAEARQRQARGWRFPQIRLSETWIRTDSPAEAFALQLNQERFDFGDFVQGDPNDPDPLDTAISRIELEIPLFTGGELSTRVEQAGRAAEAAGSETRRAGDVAALAAAEAWIGLAQAREYAELLGRSREAVAAHVEQARAFSAQGMLVRSELLRAEVELARMDDLVTEAEGNVRLAEAALAFRLGEPDAGGYVLTAIPSPAPLGDALAPWLETAEERPDLVAARHKLAAGELEAEALRGGLWPRIGVVARQDWSDDRLFGTHGDSTSIYAAASFDLFDGGRRRAAIAAALAEAEAGRQDVAQFVDGIRLEIRQAWESARVALERRTTAARALESAAEALRITEERFEAGVVRTLDVLDAATALREAETRELVARADAQLAALRLATAAGRRPESVLSSDPIPNP